MHNFKVGDVVERLDDVFLHLVGPGPHVVTGVDTTGRLQINDWCGWCGITHPWCAEYFTLVEAGDDELPPAPESVRYNDEYPDRTIYEQTWLDVKRNTHRIYLESGQYGTSRGVGMEISPEAALQLAHDLNRMAMEIRRKEKQG